MIRIAIFDSFLNMCEHEWELMKHYDINPNLSMHQLQLTHLQNTFNFCQVIINPYIETIPTIDIFIFCDKSIQAVLPRYDVSIFGGKCVYLAIMEPIEYQRGLYDTMETFAGMNINRIFTHDEYILTHYNNAFLMPMGGTFLHKRDNGIHLKSKNISAILSNNNYFKAHKFRLECASACSQYIDGRFGDFYGNKIENKIEGLRDYRYHFNVENAIHKNFFSEKIIDCFLTGTIPIYCGAPNIGDFFDKRGILCFSTIEECCDIMRTAGVREYNLMIPYIHKNYTIAKYYANYYSNLIEFVMSDALKCGLLH